MIKKILLLFFSVFTMVGISQNSAKTKWGVPYAFKGGEWLKFRLSYSNFLNAGYSTIEVTDTKNDGQDAFHIIGKGKSTGLISLFFKVNDNYETFIYKESLLPYKFIRKIDEGGYTKNLEIYFDQVSNEATVKNVEHQTEKKYRIADNIQDMLSALYFLRNQDLSKLSKDDKIELKMFVDDDVTTFKLLFLGKEQLKTKFGKVNTLIFRPLVQAGRVFKAQESLTVWISDDANKIPLLVKASLAVGSLRADLDEFKGLANPFNIIFSQ